MKYLYVIISLFVLSAFGQSLPADSDDGAHVSVSFGEEEACYSNPCYGQSNGFIQVKNTNGDYQYRLINGSGATMAKTGVATWENLPAGEYEIKVDRRDQSWWGDSYEYRYSLYVTLINKAAVSLGTLTGSDICSPATSGTITLSGYQSEIRYTLRNKNNISQKYNYYNINNNVLEWTVPAGQYEVIAGYSFGFDYCPGSAYRTADQSNLFATNNIIYNCQAASNVAEVRSVTLSQPSTAITTSGCESLSLTCSPSNTNWYWQTSDGGTSTSNPSTVAYSVNANTTYYLRAYNGSCWSSALSYRPTVRQPAQPLTNIGLNGGCDGYAVLSCSPSNANWYWQTSSNGTLIDPELSSTREFTVTSSGTYYLRAYDPATQCWSSALGAPATVLNPPVKFQLTGYDFCGSNSGKVELAQSQTGLTYQLMAGRGSIGSLAGTGNALQWTGLSADTYWVEAKYSNPAGPVCTTEMLNRVTVRAITSEVTADFDTKRILCATKFIPTSNLGLGKRPSYRWEFGDTNTSNSISPVHAYQNDGTYSVSMTIDYYVDCSGRNLTNCRCGETLSKQVTKSITTTSLPASEAFETKTYTYDIPVYENILTSSVNTFHSAWPYRNVSDSKNPYVTGEDGIWRTSGSYAYKADRLQSAEVMPATDGTYTMEQFNWEAPDISAQWLKSEEVVEYSAFSKPVMVEDVLQVPTSALYDYGGYLQSAQGVNMKNKEMAFTGFEYMDKYKSENTAGRVSGNWNFGLSPVNVKIEYKAEGTGNYILVKAPLKKFENVNEIYVQVRYCRINLVRSSSGSKTISLNTISLNYYPLYPRFVPQKIICKQASADKNNTDLVVEHDVWNADYWEGNVIIPQTIRSFESPDVSVAKAHTGKSSLRITRDQTFPQEILKLDSGRSYYLSAWVTASEITTSTAGIDVLFMNKDNVQAASFPCRPEGLVIEGWQQIRGTFICPKNDMKVSLTFKRGEDEAYYDDLRLHPSQGNMESYVYDVTNYKLLAKLDAENFATLYYYDKEGQLRVTKKETTDGVKTLSETLDYVKVKN